MPKSKPTPRLRWVTLPVTRTSDLPPMIDGDEVRVRLASGRETAGIWSDGPHARCWRSKRGEPLDVTAVGVPYRNQRPGGSIGGPSGASGPSVTESEWRERGRLQLKIRIAPESRERLDELCEDSGLPMGLEIESLVSSAHAIRGKKAARKKSTTG